MAKKRSTSTPATRELSQRGIPFVEHNYRHDPTVTDFGAEAAREIGVAPDRVFKTLLTTVDDDLIVAVVPVSTMLDLRALARVRGGKRARLADPLVAERKTGYVVGGISPIGQKSQLPTVIDSSADRSATIFVSGGRRGLDLELSPDDLVTVTRGVWAMIASQHT